jgi:hypothetical protein
VEQAVGERRLAVVNVGNDAEISYVCGVHFFSNSERDSITGKRLMKRKFDQPPRHYSRRPVKTAAAAMVGVKLKASYRRCLIFI